VVNATSHTPPVRARAGPSLRKGLQLIVQETYGEIKVDIAKVNRGWDRKDKKRCVWGGILCIVRLVGNKNGLCPVGGFGAFVHSLFTSEY